ncbi:MAG TPA: hypothetical protein EYN07_10695 [Flavobacteriaceae bacterium]|nr:hypothetical protein [Flavobacteriaceae bacterium]HIN99696.1 hypothetical protein [Flavobacteriaceae bacterium]
MDRKYKILILGRRNKNPFFDSIEKYSKHDYVYGDVSDFKTTYDFVLINWPELLIDNKANVDNETTSFKNAVLNWQGNFKIIYLVHNFKPHTNATKERLEMYKVVYEVSDIFIHMGSKSLELLQREFPSKAHYKIPHPLYEFPFKFYEKASARKILNIDSETKVVVAPGTIRKDKERTLVIDAFNAVQSKNKLLLVPRMKWQKSNIEFRGRHMLKRFFDVKKAIERRINKPKKDMRFGYGFIPFDDFSLQLSSADIIIIPRLDVLNSGNLFLGLSYKKIVVGPDIGNIVEFLDEFDLPRFKIEDSSSLKKAMLFAEHLVEIGYEPSQKKLNTLKANVIADKWDQMYNSEYHKSNKSK